MAREADEGGRGKRAFSLHHHHLLCLAKKVKNERERDFVWERAREREREIMRHVNVKVKVKFGEVEEVERCYVNFMSHVRGRLACLE